MKHTRPSTMVAFAVIGVVGGWFLDAALAAMGEPVIVPPYSLAVVLVILAVLVVVAAVPVRRAVRDGTRVDPFYAMRVVVLAKASTLTASLLAGGGVGILIYLLSRPVVPGPGAALMALAAAGGAIALLIGGLVAERMCTVPPEDDEDTPAGIAA
jgi:hypothetical protein